ncbi:MAG: lipopolysaccharide biosynthesis protein [Coleofasciculus chthonoplastes F3-SA18-01]|uniref:lipopolysaccharide biosynthesis protein n=1 Tax=Coleofasciculus chthonoplastes TaxID=64178 RepID=UPI0032FBCA73
MNLRQKAVKGVVWSAIQSWGTQAIAFIVFFVLARLLEPEAFGLVALAGVFLAFIQIFIDQGLSTAIVQRQELEPEHLDTAFWTNLGISLLLTLFGIAAAGVVAELFKEPQLAPILRWLSLSFLFIGLNGVQQAIFERQLAFKALAVRSLVAVVAGGVVGVVMAFLGFGVWSLVGKQLVNGLVGVLALWGASDWRPGFKVSIKHFRELFSFGINLVGIRILSFLSTRGDDFLIGYFLGSVALGYYTVAYRLLQILNELLVTVINKTAIPVFSRIQEEPERLRQALYTATELCSFVACPVFLGISVLAPELIIVIFGEQWIPSIPVMQILMLIGLLYALFYFTDAVIMSVGKSSWSLGVNVVATVANLVAFMLVVRWGIVAVAAAYVIRGYLMSPIRLWLTRKLIHIDLITYFRKFASPLTASMVMVFTLLVAKHFLERMMSLPILLAIYIVIGIIIYSVTILIIAPSLTRRVIDLSSLGIGKFKI